MNIMWDTIVDINKKDYTTSRAYYQKLEEMEKLMDRLAAQGMTVLTTERAQGYTWKVKGTPEPVIPSPAEKVAWETSGAGQIEEDLAKADGGMDHVSHLLQEAKELLEIGPGKLGQVLDLVIFREQVPGLGLYGDWYIQAVVLDPDMTEFIWKKVSGGIFDDRWTQGDEGDLWEDLEHLADEYIGVRVYMDQRQATWESEQAAKYNFDWVPF